MGSVYTKPVSGRIEAAGNKLKAAAESSWSDISTAWGGVTKEYKDTGIGAAAKYAGKSAWDAMGAKSYAAIGGAGLGGAYGAYSDDTSVTGGAFMGAGLGVGAMVGGSAASKWWGNSKSGPYQNSYKGGKGKVPPSWTGGSGPYSDGYKGAAVGSQYNIDMFRK